MNAPLVFAASRAPWLRIQILEVIGALSEVSQQIELLASMELRPSPGDPPQIAAAFESAFESLDNAVKSLAELRLDLLQMSKTSARAIREARKGPR